MAKSATSSPRVIGMIAPAKPGVGDGEALDGGEHADCGRDHAVADQEPRAKHQRPKQHADTAVLAIMQQAVEREYAALAVVLRLQHEEGVFDRDDEGQRPDHERNGADRVLGRAGRRNAENLVHGVKGRSADVAIDDPERAQRKRPDAGVWSMVRRLARWRVRGRGVGSGVIERTLSCSRARKSGHGGILRRRVGPINLTRPLALRGTGIPPLLAIFPRTGRDSRPAKAGVDEEGTQGADDETAFAARQCLCCWARRLAPRKRPPVRRTPRRRAIRSGTKINSR